MRTAGQVIAQAGKENGFHGVKKNKIMAPLSYVDGPDAIVRCLQRTTSTWSCSRTSSGGRTPNVACSRRRGTATYWRCSASCRSSAGIGHVRGRNRRSRRRGGAGGAGGAGHLVFTSVVPWLHGNPKSDQRGRVHHQAEDWMRERGKLELPHVGDCGRTSREDGLRGDDCTGACPIWCYPASERYHVPSAVEVMRRDGMEFRKLEVDAQEDDFLTCTAYPYSTSQSGTNTSVNGG
ncbi:hypothetical protein ACHAW5_009973 [Stephanodiscus triporus]|uniref:Uncharacterized protein n=1 Tax=Stephanodiscus triporus TaxID=2934178 RepID=A0ABD3PLV6_9STRA